MGCQTHLGISSETKHKRARREPREMKDPYPNLIFSTWDTIDRPRQVIVSDMTAIRLSWWMYFEIVLYFDAFTKQILGCGISSGKGGNSHYYDGLR